MAADRSQQGGLIMKICLVASPGGHLTQLVYLEEAFKEHELFYATYLDERTLRLPRAYLLRNVWKRPITLFSMPLSVCRIFLKEKPDLIISTGAEIAIPFFLVARFFRIKTIFIETLTRISTRSITGSVLYPISTVFLVQSPNLLSNYGKKAAYWGSLL